MHVTTFSFRASVGIGMTAVTLLCQSYMHQGIIQLEYSTGCTYVRYDESMTVIIMNCNPEMKT